MPPSSNPTQRCPSLFLTALPREIRLQIYNLCHLQHNLIHIVPSSTPLGLLSRRCALSEPDTDHRPGHVSSVTPSYDDCDDPPLVYEGMKQVLQEQDWCPFGRAYELPHRDAPAVLLVCRTMYEEAAPMFLRDVTWSMCDPVALLRLKCTIPAPHFQSIHHIQFSQDYYAPEWDRVVGEGPGVEARTIRERLQEFWRLLAGLPALKSVKVGIMYRSDYLLGEPTLEEGYLSALIACGLRGIKSVDVQIKWKMYMYGMANGQPAERLTAVEETVKQAWMS